MVHLRRLGRTATLCPSARDWGLADVRGPAESCAGCSRGPGSSGWSGDRETAHQVALDRRAASTSGAAESLHRRVVARDHQIGLASERGDVARHVARAAQVKLPVARAPPPAPALRRNAVDFIAKMIFVEHHVADNRRRRPSICSRTGFWSDPSTAFVRKRPVHFPDHLRCGLPDVVHCEHAWYAKCKSGILVFTRVA